jgi:hypothetical protein
MDLAEARAAKARKAREATEANRHDPQYGDPLQYMLTIASFWVECAWHHHPERQAELDALSLRLDDVEEAGLAGDAELADGLAEIIAVMRAAVPLLSRG